ncbi:MAG: cation:proton antiporter family protein [Nanoarchaeota archaeon]
MDGVLVSISIIIGISAILAIVARAIKQPPMIGYLIAGVLVGPFAFNLINPDSSQIITIFAHIGIALLLFIVGLSLDFRVLKEMGRVAILAGVVQVLLTAIVGYFIVLQLGFSITSAVYIGLALSFSSTVVVVKILSDKKEIDTLHGRIALGILIIQDFIAALALMTIPIIQENSGMNAIYSKVGLAMALIVGVILISVFVIQRFLNYLARNQEALFLFGIAWALTLAALFDSLGFSLEIGALMAGISLASSKYTLELGGKIKPLRDFFIVLFFIFLGSQLSPPITSIMIKNALILSAFVIIGKPLIVMIILKLFGYKKRVNFFAGVSLAQVSEFSLILLLVGFNLGQISQENMSLLVLISIFTIGISSYFLYYANRIFNKCSFMLNIFEGNKEEGMLSKKEEFDVILFGYHRIGYKLLKTLKQMKAKVLVVDYNPKVILQLSKEKINCVYGDACDPEFLREIELEKAKLVISTVTDEESNLTIEDYLKYTNSEAVFIATAEQPRQAMDLYEKGIDYVIVPHHLGGDLFSTIVKAFKTEKAKYHDLGKQHYHELKKAKDSSSF